MEASLIQPEQIEQAILLIRKELQLSDEEAAGLIFQSGRSKQRGGRRRSLPCAFTEECVAMLSSVLRSERAVQVNVAVMRAFVGLRRMLVKDRIFQSRFEVLLYVLGS